MLALSALAAAWLLAAAPGCAAETSALASFVRDIRSADELVLGPATTSRSSAQPWRYGPNVSSIGVPVADGTLVQGSWSVGGKQPDFWVDYRDEALRRGIVEPARAIGSGPGTVWEKVGAIQALVNSTLTGDGHRDRGYIAHNRSLLQENDRVASIGEYVELKAGVCRENALLTTIALREAGFDARYAYFTALKRTSFWRPDVPFGDHALALLEVDGVTYVVDSFTPFGNALNGHRLVDLLQPPRNGNYDGASPLAAHNLSSPKAYRLEANDFPAIRPGTYKD